MAASCPPGSGDARRGRAGPGRADQTGSARARQPIGWPALRVGAERRRWMPRLTVIEAGRLVDGTGAEPIEAARMIVEGAWIREVGPASQVSMPGGDVDRL